VKLDRTVKVGDILTAGALVLSAVTLASSWSKEQEIETRQDADRVRTAAAKCIGKLDRWQSLHLATYEELQVVYVQASERVSRSMADLGATRDFVWKEVVAAHTRATARVSEEQIEVAYGELLAAFPSLRTDLMATFEELRGADEKNLESFLLETQAAVLNVELKGYSPTVLGNALRAAAAKSRSKFVSDTGPILGTMRRRLFDIVQRDDRAIVERRQVAMMVRTR